MQGRKLLFAVMSVDERRGNVTECVDLGYSICMQCDCTRYLRVLWLELFLLLHLVSNGYGWCIYGLL